MNMGVHAIHYLALLFSALWLRCNQSTSVQETQSAKDTDMTCSKTLPIKATTCLQVGPMSLDWPVDPWARFDFSRSSLPPEVPSGEQQLGAFPACTRPVGDRTLFKHNRRYCNVPKGGMDVAVSFPKACGVLLGTPGPRWICFTQTKEQRAQTQIFQKDSLTPTTFDVSRRCMERTSIFRLFRYWLRDFGSLLTLFLITRTREGRLYLHSCK